MFEDNNDSTFSLHTGGYNVHVDEGLLSLDRRELLLFPQMVTWQEPRMEPSLAQVSLMKMRK